jgi:hypothetical protein
MPLIPKPTGRAGDPDHPDNLRMEREAIAGLRDEDRAQAELESYGLSQGSAADLTDRYDRAERDYRAMEREEVGQSHPNEWAR